MDNPSLRFKREDGTEYPEWKSMPLGERFSFKNGINASREAFRAEGIHCIGVSDVYKCLPITAENVIGTVAISDDEIEKNKVDYGDILFQRSSETKEDIGHAAVYYDDTPSVYNGFVICAKPDELFYEPLYLHYSLQHTRVRKQTITLGAGSGQHYNIGQEGLAQINVVFPCLEEQQRISDLVFSIDEIIAQSEAEVQNLEQQKKAAMQIIFSQEVRFKREDGTEYSEWETDIIGNCVNVTSCKRVHQSDWTDSGVPFYRAREIVALYNNEAITPLHISIEKYKELSEVSGVISSGDLLVTGVGTIGVPYLVRESDKFYFKDGNIIWFQNTEDRVLGSFLYYTLGTSEFQTKILQDSGKGTVHTFTIANAKETTIVVPCLEEQQKIADFLSAYDEVISYAKQELEYWKQLKKGLLQQMFV